MGNPYYIEPKTTAADWMGQSIRMMAMKQEADIAKDRSGLMREDLALRGRAQQTQEEQNRLVYGAGGFKERELGLMDAQRKTEARKLPVTTENFGPEDTKGMSEMLKQSGFDKPFKPLLDSMGNLANHPGFTKGKAYMFAKANWPAYQKMLVESTTADIDKEVDPARRQLLSDFLGEIQKDSTGQTIDMMMPDVARQIQMENMEAASKGVGTNKVVGNALVGPDGKVIYQGKENAPPSYFTPLQTTEGIQVFDNRSGSIKPLTGAEGKPLLSPQADPELAGRKKAAVEDEERKAKLKASIPKVRDSLKGFERQVQLTEKTIDDAIKMVGPFTAGVGSYLSIIPATTAKDLQEKITTIQANIGFDKLQSMRENSPSGGALGQVSDFENKLLQAVQGSLDTKQSPSQLIENLMTVKVLAQQLKAQKQSAFNGDFKEVMPKENESKKLTDPTIAADYMRKAGGDKARARELAKQDGWDF